MTFPTRVLVSLTGTGINNTTASVTPTSLTFTGVPVTTVSGAKPVVITNSGTNPLHFGNQTPVIVSNVTTSATQFKVVDNTCQTFTLAPGESCTIAVVYTPTFVANTVSAELEAATNASGATADPVVVGLTGSSISQAHSLSVTPALLTFGTLSQTTASPIQYILVTNHGQTADLTVTLDGTGYEITSDTCVGHALAAGTVCAIGVQFQPTVTGVQDGVLTITAGTGSITVPLFGMGTSAFTVTVSPSPLAFGSTPIDSTVFKAVIVTNTGTRTLTDITAETQLDTAFFEESNGCEGITLLPGNKCVIVVGFDPETLGATQTDVLDITDAAGTQSVVLTGTGLAAQISLVANPTSVTFGGVGMGSVSPTKYVTITNNGQAVSLDSPSVTGSGDYTLSADTCTDITLGTGATCRIGVSFNPSTLGNDDGTLVVPVAGGQSLEIPLAGVGLADTTVTVSPTTIQFPTLQVGQTSNQVLVTVTNTGTNPLQVETVAPLEGNDPTDFVLVTNTCVSNIVAPGGHCTIGVDFKPLVRGHLTASMLITDNALGEPQVVELLGNATAPGTGYDLVGSDGGVFVFDAPGQMGGFFGSLPGIHVTPVKPIVGIVPTIDDQGYFLVGSDGGVFAFGNAPYLGSLPGIHVTPNKPIVGIVAANTDKGYFLVGKDGGVFAFGTVPFLGSLPGDGISVNNVIGIASTPTGSGYWVITATGTVYAFGTAANLGTAKGSTSPVAAIAGTATGQGYWVALQNGGVDSFGSATKFGTLPGINVVPTLPIIGIVPTAHYTGYWLLGSDGGVFAFSAPFVGSLPGIGVHVTNIVGAVPN